MDSSDAGWILGTAWVINDSGLIVGAGTDLLGHDEAFLLTPVPEPSSLILLAIGGLAAGGMAVFRRRTARPRRGHEAPA